MEGKKWMRLHFSGFLHWAAPKPCSSSSHCTLLTSNIPLLPILSLFNPWGCQLGTTELLHDRLLRTYALTFWTPCPGQAEVVSPRFAQGLRALSAFYFVHPPCAPHLCNCAPMLYMHYLLKKGSVPRACMCHLCSTLSANNCAICLQNCVSCPRNCAQLFQLFKLSASRMCLLWTWQVLQQKQKCGCFSWHTVGDCLTCLRE